MKEELNIVFGCGLDFSIWPQWAVPQRLHEITNTRFRNITSIIRWPVILIMRYIRCHKCTTVGRILSMNLEK